MGRPPEPVPQGIADQVVDWISEGKTLREFCRQDGKPHYSTVYDWIEKDEDFSQRFARARLIGEEVIHQQCLAISDTQMMGEIVTEKPYTFEGAVITDKTGVPVILVERKTADMIDHRKLMIDTRLKLLAKWNPKKYGERLDMNLAGEVAIKRVVADL
jgi:phosphohistidine swiveling domain-containing protein